jgi:hypothetical protein
MLSSCLRLGPPNGLFPSGFPTKILYFILSLSLSHAHYVYRQSNPPWFDHANNFRWNLQVMKLLIMQPSPASHHFLPLILHRTLFLHTVSLCSSLSVTDHISHTFKTTNKLFVLLILIFKFLDRMREVKETEQNGSEQLHQHDIRAKFWGGSGAFDNVGC